MIQKNLQNYKLKNSSKPKLDFKKGLAVLLIGLAVLIGCLELTNTTHLFHKGKASSGPIPTINENKSSDTDLTPNSANSDQANNGKTTSNPEKTPVTKTSSAELQSPSGNFVSNHHPRISNNASEESICITSPGATCTITFTKNGIVKTLEAKKANANGTVVWAWNVKTAGLETGSWTIKATAKLDDQSKSLVDIQNLEVQP